MGTSGGAPRRRSSRPRVALGGVRRTVRDAARSSRLTRRLKRVVPARYLNRLRPDWHRKHVGGLWDTLGALQFEFLVGEGLRPDHYLLDVGCGSLRGGVRFIRYLDAGHYFGVDKDEALLEAGRDVELGRATYDEKRPVLASMDDFGFSRLPHDAFEYALAQSVFTHLPLNSVILCLRNIEEVLAPGGRFYATFFENPYGRFHTAPIRQHAHTERGGTSYFDRDPYHYDVSTFEWICDGSGLTVRYLGDWNHPGNQKMLVFTKGGDGA